MRRENETGLGIKSIRRAAHVGSGELEHAVEHVAGGHENWGGLGAAVWRTRGGGHWPRVGSKPWSARPGTAQLGQAQIQCPKEIPIIQTIQISKY
jgi:hypothetical protein